MNAPMDETGMCAKGLHYATEANTYVNANDGRKRCRACARENWKKRVVEGRVYIRKARIEIVPGMLEFAKLPRIA